MLLLELVDTSKDRDPLSGVAVFVTAARARTFTDAAQRLGLTKSAVGKSVARLEERLGFKLFHRTTRLTKLTTDGEAHLAACTAAIEEVSAAQAALSSRHQILSGRLHIDMPLAFGRRALLPVVIEITRPHPDLNLTFTFTDATSDLVARHLVTQDRVICASSAYLRMRGEPSTMADVRTHRCVVGALKGPPMVWFVKDGGADKRFTPPATHRFSDGEAMVAAAIAGMGLAQLPALLVREHIASGTLRPILQSFSASGVEVHAVWPRQKHLSPRVRYVVDQLIAYAAMG